MPVPIILAVGGVLLVLLLAWGPVRARLALQDLQQTCSALEAQLATLRTQGGSVDEQARLEVQIDECQEALRAAGIEVDELDVVLGRIREVRRQMQGEWTHFRSTDYSDITKRGNIRGTILRLGEELEDRYRAALNIIAENPDPAERLTDLRELLKEVRIDHRESAARVACYRSESPGCGRYAGSTEESPQGKVDNEMSRVRMPLRDIENEVRELIEQETGERVARTNAAGEEMQTATAEGGGRKVRA